MGSYRSPRSKMRKYINEPERWYSKRWFLLLAGAASVLLAIHVAANLEAQKMNRELSRLRGNDG